ncbi:MAG: hypothetical protein COB04_02455 [Gammaproteobacteria bacterium]|nr:MAG: hypothetical protein COB04_02455 [Gammaproteobacteria bacterium]
MKQSDPQSKTHQQAQQSVPNNARTRQAGGQTQAAAQLMDTPLMQRKASEQHHLFSEQSSPVAQRQENKTGLPDTLKSGMENVSGMSLDHVKVHYNSSKPAAVQAHAYAQGADIHLSSGQEKHLPHELGHVVQQAQGRVKPTMNVNGMSVNDNAGLENEATAMGEKAAQ